MSARVVEVPVVIVGGGPAGLATAVELGLRGVECLVVEPRTTVDAGRPRAKTTSARTMEHLRRWGLADRLRERAPLRHGWSHEVIFTTGLLGAEITRFRDVFGLRAVARGEAAEDGLQVPQPVVEQFLREVVAELPTVSTMFGAEAKDLQLTGGGPGVRVDVTGPDGPVTVHARYAVGADGPAGITRAAIGARYDGSSGELPNLSVVFDAPELRARVALDDAVQYWVVGGAASGLMGSLDGQDRWWAIVQQAPPAGVDPVDLLRALIGCGEELALQVVSTDPWTARMLVADRYQSGPDGPVFLVGDAAHLNPPWGGHGFNTAVGDAVNLGWKLAARLAGWGGPGLTASYESERRPVAVATVAAAAAQQSRLAPSFVTPALPLPGPDGQRARAEVARLLLSKDGEFHSEGLVLGTGYPDSPVVVGDGAPPPEPDPVRYHGLGAPGLRLPHAVLPDGPTLYDALGPDFTLLVAGAPGRTAGFGAGGFVAAAEARGLPLTVLEVPASVLESGETWPLVLVRPDQHVAWRGVPPMVESDAAGVLDVACGGAV